MSQDDTAMSARWYSIATIRALLLAAFTAEELRRFCQDRPPFRPISDRFGPNLGFDDMVARAIDYCESRRLFYELLAEVKKHNPRQYARFEPDLFVTTPPPYDLYAQASAALNRHIRLREFETLVEERTRHFVGREFIFRAIEDYLQDPEFPSGYIEILGEPGIGKTALVAELVRRRGYVHHFNIATQNIRSAQDFLANVCAQLIVRHELAHHNTLPPEAIRDGGFLSQLLAEIAEQREGPTVALVDALDEAEDLGLPPAANILYLPQTLPDGLYFVVTAREKADLRLFVDRSKDIYLRDNDPQNLADVRRYVRSFLQKHQARMSSLMEAWGTAGDEFVEIITDKSEGNFMYLVYVLGDIRDGKLATANLDQIHHLPRGLQAYYRRHWRSMRAQHEERFDTYYEPVVCILATVREPVTIAQVQEWTGLNPARIKMVIDDWREFLNVDESGAEPLYRIYHASFQDFLKREVGLVPYHERIARTALDKIPGFVDGGHGR